MKKTKTGYAGFVRTFALLLICFTARPGLPQTGLDSLLHIVNTGRADSGRADALSRVAWHNIGQAEYSTAINYADQLQQLSEQINFQKGLAESHNIRGVISCIQSEYPTALGSFLKSLRINESLGLKKNISRNLSNIGIVHMYQKNFHKSLEYFEKSNRLNQERGDREGIAGNLLNMALVYRHQKNYRKAIEYYSKSHAINRELNREGAIANSLFNMGIVFQDMSEDSLFTPNKDTAMKHMERALQYYLQALKLQEKIGDRNGETHNRGSIAAVYLNLKRYREAETFIRSALKLSEELGIPELQSFHHNVYANVMESRGDYAAALAHFKKFKELQDTLYNTEKRKALVEKELEFEFEKKQTRIQAIAEAEKDKIRAVAREEKKQQQLILMSVAIGLLLTIIFSTFIYNRFRVTRRQKRTIESQKHLVEIKNREINESIAYARHLQNAILPPDSYIREFLPESFVLYKPKDIVAGDFYWMEALETQAAGNTADAGWIFIAAADSTGHGVPGAMVSVICGNALNRAVLEFGLREPGLILDKTTDIVLETFMKSGQNIQDGMDISLLAIHHSDQKVMWAGANNNLLYILPGVPEPQEITANKQPVGKSDHRKSFTTHTIPYQKGTLFYLFTDGYADQFGGPLGKKFKYRQLKDLAGKIAGLPTNEQKLKLDESFVNWKKDHEQVDDVCVVGLRL